MVFVLFRLKSIFGCVHFEVRCFKRDTQQGCIKVYLCGDFDNRRNTIGFVDTLGRRDLS